MTWILGVKLIVSYDMKNAVAHTYIPFSKIKLFFFQLNQVEKDGSIERQREAWEQHTKTAANTALIFYSPLLLL